MKPDTNMVLADADSLAGVGLERVGVAGEDSADDVLLEAGFFFGEVGFGGGGGGVFVVVGVGVGEVEVVEEEVFERLVGEEGGRRGGGGGGRGAEVEFGG